MEQERNWHEIIEEFINKGKTALLIGNVDTGKTSFITHLANQLIGKKLKAAIVDGDIGQSSIGPPGTIGMGIIEDIIEKPSEVSPVELYFVGSINPQHNLLKCLTGMKLLLEKAQSLSPDKIIVDTTGMVSNEEGIVLKQSKIELLKPDFIFSFSKNNELEPILNAFRYLKTCKIRAITIDERVKRKPPEFRASQREKNFLDYFVSPKFLKFDLLATGVSGMFIQPGGKNLNSNEIRWLSSTLDFPIKYAQKSYNKLVIEIPHLCDLQNINIIKERYSVSEVITLDPVMNLAGLIDDDGLICIGIITDFNLKNNIVECLIPFNTERKIKRFHVGSYKLPDEIFNKLTKRRI